nr:hypothetical protein [Enterococcus cecorum]
MSDLQEKIEATLVILKKLKKGEDITEDNMDEMDEITVSEKQSSNGNKGKFDPDSSPEAWDYFKVFNDKIKTPNLKNNRLIWKSETIDIAGDCSFNFNDNKMESFKEMKLEDLQKN